jgi:hypothetical protein
MISIWHICCGAFAVDLSRNATGILEIPRRAGFLLYIHSLVGCRDNCSGFVFRLLLDCSPRLPATCQFILTVSARNFSSHTFASFTLVLAGRMVHYFRIWGRIEKRRVYTGENADCFWHLGAYQVCDATQYLSIYSNLFLLMLQALVSRILVPGMSNFENASVRHVMNILCLTSCYQKRIYLTTLTLLAADFALSQDLR